MKIVSTLTHATGVPAVQAGLQQQNLLYYFCHKFLFVCFFFSFLTTWKVIQAFYEIRFYETLHYTYHYN